MGRICNIQGAYLTESNSGSCLMYQVYVPDVNKSKEAIDLGKKQNYKIVDDETQVCCFSMPKDTVPRLGSQLPV